MTILETCPTAPDWLVPWETLRADYAFIDALHECPQDAQFHAEGDVGIHTRMACEALAGSAEFRALPENDRRIVFVALLLHDVAKPMTTRHEDNGRISSRGHSNRGEIYARRFLWRSNVSFKEREAICALIRYHQVPFFLLDRRDSRKLAYRISQIVRTDHLALLAWADGFGRRCAEEGDQRRILENVALFREYCDEHRCFGRPRDFPSDHSRFQYFQKDNRDPNYLAHDDTSCEVTLMSGLPGAGKDSWIRRHAQGLQVVSLDSIREQLGVAPAEPQRRVVDEGRRRAKQFLRQAQSFVWNATNVSRQIREQLIALFAQYNARIKIVYVESPETVLLAQNERRETPVPTAVIEKLASKWTVPNNTEAHSVVFSLHE